MLASRVAFLYITYVMVKAPGLLADSIFPVAFQLAFGATNGFLTFILCKEEVRPALRQISGMVNLSMLTTGTMVGSVVAFGFEPLIT